MKTLVIYIGKRQHLATESDEINQWGEHFIACSCGRSGWGRPRLSNLHANPDSTDYTVRYPVVSDYTPLKGWRRIWDPPWENRQDKRDYLSRGLDNSKLPHWMRRSLERRLCNWYGHTPSANPTICYWCHRKRGRRGRWNPTPERPWWVQPLPVPRGNTPPAIMPPVSTLFGPPPIPPLPAPRPIPPPASPPMCNRHGRRQCPICSRRKA